MHLNVDVVKNLKLLTSDFRPRTYKEFLMDFPNGESAFYINDETNINY